MRQYQDNVLEGPKENEAAESAIAVRINTVAGGAQGVGMYELARLDHGCLPAVEPGAHVTLLLPNGMARQYSILNPQSSTRCYRIAVKLEQNGRGGSRYIHDSLRPGDTLAIRPPINNFRLVDDAGEYVLIAGGIGITPVWAMWTELTRSGKNATLVYSCRSRKEALFVDQLRGRDKVILHFNDEQGGAQFPLETLLQPPVPGRHAYCCGPQPMLRAFTEMTGNWPKDHVHIEYFLPDPEARAGTGDDKEFIVELHRSGKEVVVKPDESILQAIQASGVDVACDCREGICGACMTKVVFGIPDHRDFVLDEEERNGNRLIMICCSRSKSERLVIDV